MIKHNPILNKNLLLWTLIIIFPRVPRCSFFFVVTWFRCLFLQMYIYIVYFTRLLMYIFSSNASWQRQTTKKYRDTLHDKMFNHIRKEKAHTHSEISWCCRLIVVYLSMVVWNIFIDFLQVDFSWGVANLRFIVLRVVADFEINIIFSLSSVHFSPLSHLFSLQSLVSVSLCHRVCSRRCNELNSIYTIMDLLWHTNVVRVYVQRRIK